MRLQKQEFYKLTVCSRITNSNDNSQQISMENIHATGSLPNIWTLTVPVLKMMEAYKETNKYIIYKHHVQWEQQSRVGMGMSECQEGG